MEGRRRDLLKDWIETDLFFFCFKSRKDLSVYRVKRRSGGGKLEGLENKQNANETKTWRGGRNKVKVTGRGKPWETGRGLFSEQGEEEGQSQGNRIKL